MGTLISLVVAQHNKSNVSWLPIPRSRRVVGELGQLSRVTPRPMRSRLAEGSCIGDNPIRSIGSSGFHLISLNLTLTYHINWKLAQITQICKTYTIYTGPSPLSTLLSLSTNNW